jgi:hypothetical protein
VRRLSIRRSCNITWRPSLSGSSRPPSFSMSKRAHATRLHPECGKKNWAMAIIILGCTMALFQFPATGLSALRLQFACIIYSPPPPMGSRFGAENAKGSKPSPKSQLEPFIDKPFFLLCPPFFEGANTRQEKRGASEKWKSMSQ